MAEKNILEFERQVLDTGSYHYLTPESYGWARMEHRTSEFLFSMFDFKGKAVLDIACGTGEFSAEIASRGGKVVGIDASSVVAKEANRRNYNQDVTFLPADVYNLPFPDNSFQVVVLRACLHHFYRPLDALREISRITKKIILIEANGINPYRKFMENFSSMYRRLEEKSFTIFKLKNMISEIEGSITKTKYFNIIPAIVPKSLLGIFEPIESLIEKTVFIRVLGGTVILVIE